MSLEIIRLSALIRINERRSDEAKSTGVTGAIDTKLIPQTEHWISRELVGDNYFLHILRKEFYKDKCSLLCFLHKIDIVIGFNPTHFKTRNNQIPLWSYTCRTASLETISKKRVKMI